ncbi:glycosyltransferase family 9 protein [Scandinavium goeteborgense]|uniref:glycosyltransferase family 9 protein n=1 Tax=Scandinavium goeteborgense TaxID=1851514 RepID=UPI000D7C6828
MSYVLLFILFLPIKLLGKLFRKETGKNLVIQTAKIGDFVNATPLLSHLQKSDVLISKAVEPLARLDDTIETIYLIGKKKRNLLTKFQFALQIMNRYDNVYLLQPNSTNLFFAAVCNAKNKQFLSIYTRRWYHSIFYMAADGVVNHGKRTLSVTNYLQLADRNLCWEDAPKHATHPLHKPKSWPDSLDKPDVIRIGLSISAGNKAKTVPPATWKRIFDTLADLPCEYYIFGTESEQSWLDELYRTVGERANITSLLGTLPLEEVPWAISRMDCYIASDSGNVYIADAVNVPVVLLFGPCCYHEQRPLGKTLLIGSEENISSYVFETRYYFDKSREELFKFTNEDLINLYQFIFSITNKNLLKKA